MSKGSEPRAENKVEAARTERIAQEGAWGLLALRVGWHLTWRGWLCLVGLVFAGAQLAVHTVFSFLAVTDPVGGELLVVESWIPDYSMPAVIQAFAAGRYRWIATTGGPIGKGEILSEYHTLPELTRSILIKEGVDPVVIVAIPSPDPDRDRTYACALELKQWLKDHHRTISRFDLLSRGVHSRRSRLLFQRAFGPAVKVGVIAAPEVEYDGRHWWRTSAGFRYVVDETIAYIYARFLFYPRS